MKIFSLFQTSETRVLPVTSSLTDNEISRSNLGDQVMPFADSTLPSAEVSVSGNNPSDMSLIASTQSSNGNLSIDTNNTFAKDNSRTLSSHPKTPASSGQPTTTNSMTGTSSSKMLQVSPLVMSPSMISNISETSGRSISGRQRSVRLTLPRSPSFKFDNERGSARGYHSPSHRSLCADVDSTEMSNMTESKTAIALEPVPFAPDTDVVLEIDGIAGLPCAVTALRVTAELWFPTMDPVENSSVSVIVPLTAHVRNPEVRLTRRWKFSDLDPTLTLMIRLDTLEAPSLLPRLVGYGALRLCVDEYGVQPLSHVFRGRNGSGSFVNVGLFTVPVYYGPVPEDLDFLSESRFKAEMAPLDGCMVALSVSTIDSGRMTPPYDPRVPSTNSVPTSLSPGVARALAASEEWKTRNSGTKATSVTHTNSSELSVTQDHKNEASQKNDLDSLSIFGQSIASHLFKWILLHQLERPSIRSKDSTQANTPRTNTLPLASLGGLSQHSISSGSLSYLYFLPEHREKFMTKDGLSLRDRQEVLTTMSAWVTSMFNAMEMVSLGPLLTYPKNTISPSMVYEVLPNIGAFASLDMLSNLPPANLVSAAKSSAAIEAMKSGLVRPFDTCVNFHKTIFRYLPGEIPPPTKVQSSSPDDSDAVGPQRCPGCGGYTCDIDGVVCASTIVDDASLRPILCTSEYCPEFADDFSQTGGLALGPAACLLVVVTVVNVLAGKNGKGRNTKPPSRDANRPSNRSPSHATLARSGDSRSSILSEGDMVERSIDWYPSANSNEENPLVGIDGVFVGHEDARSTMWALVPLYRPYAGIDELRSIAIETFMSMQHDNHSNNYFSQGESANTEKSIDLLAEERNLPYAEDAQDPLTAASLDTISGNIISNFSNINVSQQKSSFNEIYTDVMRVIDDASSKIFVNHGAHQLPLFMGLPPKELIKAADPYGWLMARLRVQRLALLEHTMRQVVQRSSLRCLLDGPIAWLLGRKVPTERTHESTASGLSFNFPSSEILQGSSSRGNSSRGGSPSASVRRRRLKTGSEEVILSKGASVFVRIVDPRIRRYCRQPCTLEWVNSTPSTQIIPTYQEMSPFLSDVSNMTLLYSGGVTGLNVPLAGTTTATAPSPYPTASSPLNQSSLVQILRLESALDPTVLATIPKSSVSHLRASNTFPDIPYSATDNRRLRKLSVDFGIQPNKVMRGRTLEYALPQSIVHDALIAEVNSKFHQAICS